MALQRLSLVVNDYRGVEGQATKYDFWFNASYIRVYKIIGKISRGKSLGKSIGKLLGASR